MFAWRWMVAGMLVVGAAGAAGTAEAQSAHRQRRESNANRKARIARTIEDTYSHRVEVAGGGGYLRFRSGEYLQRNNEVTFFVSGMYALSPKVGIVGEVLGGYGKAKIGNNAFLSFNPQISEYAFMGGPSYRFVARQKYTVSAFGTAGAAIGKFDGASKAVTAPRLGIWNSATKPAFSAGVNLDYNLYPNLAVRVQPVYLGTLFQETILDSASNVAVSKGTVGNLQNNYGFNIGIVYRLGRIAK